MKNQKYIFLIITILTWSYHFSQTRTVDSTNVRSKFRQLSVEPSIGIHTNPGTDLLLSAVVQWNPYKHLAVASYSSYNINNPFQREIDGVKTEYNYSLNQKFGVGLTLSVRKSTHTVLAMAGIKYTSFKETIVDPALDQISIAINTTSPDYGFMYSYKLGRKKYFFTFRTYVPLYPWGIKSTEINYIDGNINNIALELGIGIRLK